MILIGVIFLQVIIFAALIYAMKSIFGQNIASATRHIDELSQDYAKKEEDVNRRLEEVKQKSETILAKAQEEADSIRAKILAETESGREKTIKETREHAEDIMKQAERSREQLISEIDARIERGSIDRACDLMDESLPDQFKRAVHSQWVKDLIDSGFRQLEHVRIPEDVREVKVASAFALDKDEKMELSKKIKEHLGENVDIKEEVDAKIVAGIVIVIGSLVLDGSLKNKVEERAKVRK